MAEAQKTGTTLYVLLALTAGMLMVHLSATNAIGDDKKGPVIQVDLRHNGGKVSLPIGGSLVITLPAQPGTGYGWQVTSPSSQIVQLQSNVFRPGDGLPSGNENQILTFLAGQAGKAVLVLSYRGPGDTAAPAAKLFQLTVTVIRP